MDIAARGARRASPAAAHGDRPVLRVPRDGRAAGVDSGGTGFAGDVWLPDQVPALADRPRSSSSTRAAVAGPSGPSTVHTIDHMAADSVTLLNHLGVPAAHVLGHSMGGRIGLAMALDFPGRVKSLIMARRQGSGVAGDPRRPAWPGLPEQLADARWRSCGVEGYVRHEICETGDLFQRRLPRAAPRAVRAFRRWPGSSTRRVESSCDCA